MSIVAQNIIAYGSGFIMASYFPYYFYRAFNLKAIRFHARYGVLLFLLLPYVIFFIVIYPITKNLDHATSYGMIIPFIYSIVVLYAMLDAIRTKIRKRNVGSYPYNKLEMIAVYAAVSPWVTMSVFAYLHIDQWIEVLVTNLGFLVITILFITKSIKQARLENEKLEALYTADSGASIFEQNCVRYSLTKREVEIAILIQKGMQYKYIADKLFISIDTVKSHNRSMFRKLDVNDKTELVYKLNQKSIENL